MEVCILDTNDLTKAQLAKSKLESNGIFSELRTNDAGGVLPHLRLLKGVQLYVSKENSEQSLKILKELI